MTNLLVIFMHVVLWSWHISFCQFYLKYLKQCHQKIVLRQIQRPVDFPYNYLFQILLFLYLHCIKILNCIIKCITMPIICSAYINHCVEQMSQKDSEYKWLSY